MKVHKDGFTLLEVMIALGILTTAFAWIIMAESGSLRASSRTIRFNEIFMLAKNKMIETEEELESKSFKEVEEESEGTFEAPLDRYSWKREITEIEFPSFVSSDDESTRTSELMARRISNYLSESVRKVKVTIFWEKSGVEQKFDISTFWVDLKNDVKIQ